MTESIDQIDDEMFFLAGPKGINLFTRDPDQIRQLGEAFGAIIEQARADCAELGLTIRREGRFTGQLHVAGPADTIAKLSATLSGRGHLLGER